MRLHRIAALALGASLPMYGSGCVCAGGERATREGEPPLTTRPESTASAHPALPAPSAARAPAKNTAARGAGLIPCRDRPIHEIAPGLVLERFVATREPPVAVGDRCITLVRVDPARYRFRLLTAASDGGSRTAPEWVESFQLAGVINASMFAPDRRSIGLLVSGRHINNGEDNSKLGGFMAFTPQEPGAPEVAFFGRSCLGFDVNDVRRRYGSIVQNYRLLDCDGSAIPWKDEKVYSAAAIGQDKQGRVVLIHTRTPYTMTMLASILAAPGLELRAAHYVEGGPEASLYVRAGNHVVSEIGSYETNFNADDANKAFWPIPNIIGFAPVEGAGAR